MDEREVTTAQVLQVLKRGELTKGPDWNPEHESWQFTIRASTAGELVAVAAAIAADPLLKGHFVLVVTVFV